MRALFLFLLTILMLPQPAISQDEPEMKIEDAMESMLDSHPYRYSIFWVMPAINVNSGYDSNGLYAPSGEVIGDYFFSVAPGASVGLRFGNRAFLVVDEHVNFLYYRELDQLRDVFNRTSARFTTGSRRTLWNLYGAYVNRKTGVDSEFDVPVQQKSASGGIDVDLALATRWELGFHFNTAHHSYEDAADDSALISLPPDYRIYRYGNTVLYRIHPFYSLFANANIGTVEFLNQNNRQNNTLRVFGGVRISLPNVKGQIRLGYGQTQIERTLQQDDLKSLVGSANVDFLLRGKTTVGGYFRRDHDISRIGANNFRITTEGGLRVSFPLGKKMFADGSYSIAKNDYGERIDVAGVVQLNDVVHTLHGGLNFQLLRNLILRGGGIYYSRDSNIRRVEKKRFAYDIGIRYAFNP